MKTTCKMSSAKVNEKEKCPQNVNNSSVKVNEADESQKQNETSDESYRNFRGRSQESSLFSPVKELWNNNPHSQIGLRRCEANVMWCTQNNSLVKLMMTALKSHGCEVDLSRHVACEKCSGGVNGGFDTKNNQVVICSNVVKKRDVVCSVLAHEFTHAFDKCRAKVDFTNLEHLACSEIRASNFSHCSFNAAISSGVAKSWDYKEAHQTCVKNKASKAVMFAGQVPLEKAMLVVDKVFDKCYNDLEPVGRIPRKFTHDAYLSLVEGELYGYTESK